MKPFTRLLSLPRYLQDLRAYMRAPGAEPWSRVTLKPMLEERTASHGFDAHYVYLGAWAFRHITRAGPPQHIDVAGQIGWVTCLASVTRVVFIDVRPFLGQVEHLESRAGSVLSFPLPTAALRRFPAFMSRSMSAWVAMETRSIRSVPGRRLPNSRACWQLKGGCISCCRSASPASRSMPTGYTTR